MDTHHATNYDHNRLRMHLVFGGFIVGLASGMISVLYRFTLGKLDDARMLLYASVTPPASPLCSGCFSPWLWPCTFCLIGRP